MATKRVQIGVSFMNPETVYVASTSGGSATTAITVYVPVVNAPITIVDRNSGVAPTVYSTETGSSTINSLTTDSGGNVDGWVVEGSYTITAGAIGSFAGATIGWESVRGDGVENVYQGAVIAASLSTTLQQQLNPPGVILDYAGVTPPSGYVFCDGAVYATGTAGSTYYNLSQALNGAWNLGNEGAGNFRVPDLRGLVTVGQSNNGSGTGQPAYNLTARTVGPRSAQSANGGIVGGEETHMLSLNELASHSHGGTTNSGTTNSGTTQAGNTNNGSTGISETQSASFSGNIPVSSTGGITWTYAQSSGQNQFGVRGASNDWYDSNLGHYHGITDPTHSHSIPSLTVNGLTVPGLGINADGGNAAHNNMQPFAVTNKIIKL